MRFLTFALTLAALGALPLPASAQSAATVVAKAEPDQFPTHAEKLNKLFTELKHEEDVDAAKGIANQIRREWQDSGSATINLLVQWADKAATEEKNGAALDFLDEAVRLKPDYVEAWNRRATLHFKMGNYRKSMSDINKVLEIEPRHFGAIAGMAGILEQTGRDELALRAWERFLDVYPSERMAQKQMGDLAEKLTGQRT